MSGGSSDEYGIHRASVAKGLLVSRMVRAAPWLRSSGQMRCRVWKTVVARWTTAFNQS